MMLATSKRILQNPTSSTDNTESESSQISGETDTENVVGDSESQSCTNEQGDGQMNKNTPEYEMDLSQKVENQRITNEEAESQDHSTLVLSDRGKETTSWCDAIAGIYGYCLSL